MDESLLKDIPGFENRYAITRDGNVWSYAKPLTGAVGQYIGHKKGKWIYGCMTKKKDGYRVINLGNKHRGMFVHRLVALTYLGESCPEQSIVNHKDGNKLNNNVDNLEWCDHQYNNKHARDMGLVQPPRKITLKTAKEIQEIYYSSAISRDVIAKQYQVGKSTIQRITSGTHGYPTPPDASLLRHQMVNNNKAFNPLKRSHYRGRKTHSKYKCVTLHKGKWIAFMTINGKRIHIGCFDKEIDAANAYKKTIAEMKLE